MSRGIRNNNPGNIDFNPRNQWQGQLQPDPSIEKRFARFDTPENGIRALAKLLLNYRGKDGEPGVGGKGIDTVYEIIHRWAPGVENDTASYVSVVAREMGVSSKQALTLLDFRTLQSLVISIIRHENGEQPYPLDVIAEGIHRAIGGTHGR